MNKELYSTISIAEKKKYYFHCIFCVCVRRICFRLFSFFLFSSNRITAQLVFECNLRVRLLLLQMILLRISTSNSNIDIQIGRRTVCTLFRLHDRNCMRCHRYIYSRGFFFVLYFVVAPLFCGQPTVGKKCELNGRREKNYRVWRKHKFVDLIFQFSACIFSSEMCSFRLCDHKFVAMWRIVVLHRQCRENERKVHGKK